MPSRPSTSVLLAGVLTVALAACGAGGSSRRAAATSAAPSSSCPSAGAQAVQGGRLYVPAGRVPGKTPLLVVVIPGGRGDPRDGLGLQRAARRAGLALLYPFGEGTFWTLNHAQGDGDVDDVRAVLDRVLAGGCFDAARLTATGVSNGAGFATRLVCALPGRFAGVAPVSAGFRALDPCSAGTHVSFLAIHGAADTVVPYNGKRPGREGSVPRFTARWARRAGCGPVPRISRPRSGVTRIAYRACEGGLQVGLVRLRGTTHSWPGALDPPFPQRNPSGFDATRAVVRFALAPRT